MRTLTLSILAAGSALVATAAVAQPGPPPGANFHGPGPQMQMMRHMGPMGPGGHFERHLRRGFVLPGFWFAPQFTIGNWQLYGFAEPGRDQRWVRYYDDAYLVDRDGRIVDEREGLDWDHYGEQWAMEDGVPAYRGARDYRPGPDDYAYGERHMRRGPMGPPPGPMGPPMGPPPGPGYGYGYGGGSTQVYGGGYGYGMYAYPIVIETVTSGAAQTGYTETVTEEYVNVHRARRHVAPHCSCAPPPRPRPVVHRPPPPVHHAPPPRPRPPAGERG